MSASVYVVGNFKGGVGKTKTVTMLSYIAATRKNRKTLVIDLDPQANATSVLAKTGDISEVKTNVTDGVINGNLEPEIIHVIENLDMIAANVKFRNFGKILMKMFPDDELAQITYLKKLIEPLKEEYDSIYLDVPPTISDFSDNAMMAADHCIVILQTQELSMDGTKTYINYMQYLIDTYNTKLDIIGILPCMLQPKARVDKKVMHDAEELYGNNVLHSIVKYQERLKAYDAEGIAMGHMFNGKPDHWDKVAHDLYENILNELDEHEKVLSGE
ncbi:ParA family protein [Lactiplantibacillus plantarum]|uniref:ParA family protein n=1 Tax=Lactiplantibacillus plantarum TaxID=1590 RepID=UPI0021A5E1ED|nr:ParA family protein [Lactiplantibacillus plantarum]MCT3214515.1 ParA family protein [Lactiplantibacillus plantarum]MCT3272094.1 ParA family protein [Lactiplantibacillus plantarum]